MRTMQKAIKVGRDECICLINRHIGLHTGRAATGAGATVGAPPDPEHPSEDWGIAVVAEGIKVGDGAAVAPKAMVTRNVKGGGAK